MKTLFSILFLSLFTFNALFAQIAAKAEDISPLLIGETLPDAQLKNESGENISLYDVLKQKPTVLVFFRGGWCPYCNAQLAGFVKAENDILKAGYQIVAITPDDYKNIKTMADKNEIKYKLFSNPNAEFLQKVGIAFNAAKSSNEAPRILPVPTVMIVNTQNQILFEYINPNFRTRLSSSLLMGVLNNL